MNNDRDHSQDDETGVTLRDYVDVRLLELSRMTQQRFEDQKLAVNAAFEASEKAIDAAMSASQKAIDKADNAIEKRLDTLNEFRAAFSDIIANQLPRSEGDERFKQLNDKIEAITKALESHLPRSEYLVYHKSLEDQVALTNKSIEDIKTRLNLAEGAQAALDRQSGRSRSNIGLIVGFIGGVASLIAIFYYISQLKH